MATTVCLMRGTWGLSFCSLWTLGQALCLLGLSIFQRKVEMEGLPCPPPPPACARTKCNDLCSSALKTRSGHTPVSVGGVLSVLQLQISEVFPWSCCTLGPGQAATALWPSSWNPRTVSEQGWTLLSETETEAERGKHI